MQCELEFEQSGDPAIGAAAARACAQLDPSTCVFEWTKRLRDTAAEAEVLGLEASVLEKNQDDAGAIAAYRRQLDLYRQAEQHALAAQSAFGLYRLHQRSSSYRDALQSARIVLEEATRADDRAEMARAYQAIYTVLWLIGDLGAAERALAASEEMLSPEDALRHSGLAARKGMAHLGRGRLELARIAFIQSLELAAENSGDERYRPFFRAIHLNLVEVYLQLERLEDAEHHMLAAETFAEPEGGNPIGLLIHRARLELAQGQSEDSIAALSQALDHQPAKDWKWELEYRLGVAQEALGHLAAAESAYLSSLETLESMRGELGFDELKAWLLELRRQPFDALFRLRASQGRDLEALEVLERAKARAFLDAFIRNTTTAPRETVRRSGSDAPGVLTLGEQIETAARRAETLLELLPSLGQSSVVAPRPIAEVLARLGSRPVWIYLEAEEDIWLTTVTRGQVDIRRLETSRAEIVGLVDRFLDHPEDPVVAAALGRLLLPADLLPSSPADLHLVTDGILGRLPFAALRVGRRYLVEDYVLTYLPSLTALTAMLERPPRSTDSAVVLGDPLGDLPAAALELSEVGRLLDATPKLGRHADRQALEQAAGADLLHLATHTGLGDLGPWLQVADGKIGAGTLLGESVGPRRVILASCASAARRGRGLWGSLGAAFLLAGSEAVVATLWSVEDAAARELMLRFYAHGGQHAPAIALARAQRDAIAAGQTPANWAPYVHFGPVGEPVQATSIPMNTEGES